MCMVMMYTSECESVCVRAHGSPNSHEYAGVSVSVGTVAGWSLGKCECWQHRGGGWQAGEPLARGVACSLIFSWDSTVVPAGLPDSL